MLPKINKPKASHKVMLVTNKPAKPTTKIVKPGAVITKAKSIKTISSASSNIIKPGTPQAAAVKSKTQKPVQSVETKSYPPKGRVNSSQTALQTASVIASNRSHPNHAEVSHLIQTFEKGWINEAKFNELLQGMLF